MAPAVFLGAADFDEPADFGAPDPEPEEALFEAVAEPLFEPAELRFGAELLFDAPAEALFDDPPEVLEADEPVPLLIEDADFEPELFAAADFEPPELFEPEPEEDPEELLDAELFEDDPVRAPLDALPEADLPVIDSMTETAAPVAAPAAAPATASPTTSSVMSYAAVKVLLFPRLAVAIVFSFY